MVSWVVPIPEQKCVTLTVHFLVRGALLFALAAQLDHSKPSVPTPPADVEDHVAAFKKMLDDILDNASAEALSQGFEPSLSSSRLGVGLSTSSSSNFLSSSSAAADRARLNRSTTLGFLLPQPKIPFAKLKTPHSRSDPATSTVDADLLHKLEEQNSSLPPQVRMTECCKTDEANDDWVTHTRKKPPNIF